MERRGGDVERWGGDGCGEEGRDMEGMDMEGMEGGESVEENRKV